MSQPKQIIKSHLTDYCDEQNIIPLAARDYGSRARNLQNDDSDYDVMFIFAHKPSAYAVGSATDHYGKKIPPEENELDTEIEFDGWDLRKFIGNDGLAGSNPTALEFCVSDEKYLLGTLKFNELCHHAAENFKPYALINHYRSLAASNYGKYIEGDYKLASDASWSDLLEHSDPPWAWFQEDAQNELKTDTGATTITEDGIDVVGRIESQLSCGHIDSEYALERGLIEPTTTERTVKRYLNVMQALTKARYIEEYTEIPEMDYTEFLREISGSEWLSDIIYSETGALVAEKRTGKDGSKPRERLDEWIEDELSRDIDPEPYVQTQPDTHRLREITEEIYQEEVLAHAVC